MYNENLKPVGTKKITQKVKCKLLVVAAFLGETTLLKLFCLPTEKRSTSNGSRFFPFRVDLILEGIWCSGEQTGSHRSSLPCKNES